MKKPSILVILGSTSSGKSDFAVALAKKLNGEVVSADSRQVYKGLDIGTGKITKKEMKGIPHHLLDVVSPKKNFTVDDFQRLAYKAIDGILSRGKVPILCGGTGFYIQSIVDGIVLPNVEMNIELRKNLVKLSEKELFDRLKKMDSGRAKEIDKQNKVRLIRAIEIATALGEIPRIIKKPKYDCLQIGINVCDEILKVRIQKRLLKRIKLGMIDEAVSLHKSGVSYKHMEELGIEYKYMSLFLQKRISKDEMIEQIKTASIQYAKRQMTWFKRDQRIFWVNIAV